MFGFLKKRNLALEQCRAMFHIERDLLLATRLHEDSVKLAERRKEDWALQAKFEAACATIVEGDTP